ncbi:hypothetical protein I5M27_16995 [Adhaeribacter sp. BT258]|uniref:Bile acid:Na+ symporter, BASS family n=1 Tax=Adhaeribacter terrigena TaxID=2793070 RepID=A0ABS1C5P7_9BACT|nr:hypothetical protein [Adhaeribacter terrigena]
MGFGLKASPGAAFYLFRNPAQLLRSVLAMNIIMPLVGISMALILDLLLLVKVALIAISVSPLAPIFPKKPLRAGGREEYIIGLMMAVSLFSIILIPITMELIEKIAHKPISISSKAILITVLVTVIIPLAFGIAIRHFIPVLSEKITNVVARIAQVILIITVIPVLFKVLPSILQLIGNGTVLAIAAFVGIGVLVGHILGGPAGEDRTVLALATATRHPAIAITLASANLPDHKLVPATILLYLLINAVVVIPYLKWLQKAKTEMY